MTPSSAFAQRTSAFPGLLRVLVILAAVLAVMAVLTVIFGVHQGGPSYEFIPGDPGPGWGLPI